jgi:LysR family hydrogen peroxide-inducible transcriptional activator
VHQCTCSNHALCKRKKGRESTPAPRFYQQIRKLEDELGVRLFDRLGRSVRLTELGHAFLPRARTVLQSLQAARSEVIERKRSVSGPISVGVIPTVAPYFLPSILAGFSRKWP